MRESYKEYKERIKEEQSGMSKEQIAQKLSKS
jgi:ribosome-binding protein aMBF1 (putative translation factor)